MEYTESQILAGTLSDIIWDFISANDGKMTVADILYAFEVIKSDLMNAEIEEEED